MPFSLRLRTAVRLALDSLAAHKLRGFLTLLGVLIGVASVVLVGAAIEGLSVTASETTAQAFGTDTFLVAQLASPGRLTRREVAEKLKRNKRIRDEDVEFLEMTTGDRVYYSPYQQRPDDVKRGNVTFEGAIVIGAAAVLPEIREIPVVQGRFYTEQEERNRAAAAVIGEDLRTLLFEGESALGQTVKIRGLDFVVVGVLEKLGSTLGRSQDNSLYIPAATFVRLFGPARSLAIFGRPRPESGLALEEGLDVARVALRTRFKTPPGEDDPFENMTPDSIRGFVENILGLITMVALPVTAISLVVGGIVIMNIMLVTVTERTREIGVRKSLGARNGDIQLQFLAEAMIVALAGGVLGLALGWAVCELLAAAFAAKLRITGLYVGMAVFISTAVGLISGWYPAARASRLDPVVALRAE